MRKTEMEALKRLESYFMRSAVAQGELADNGNRVALGASFAFTHAADVIREWYLDA